jgi:sigma-B regulation protein RsbU (phosphoserine phosphatase)
MLNLTEMSPEPIYNQISRQLFERIISGEFSVGSELAPIRTLARKEHVSVNTIKKAYLKLEQNGIIKRQSSDRFVIASITEEQKQRITQKLFKPNGHNDDIEAELKLAGQIQKSLLPQNLPCDNQLCMAAYFQPSHTVGGDFYDYIPIDENKFGIVIGDTCGKGLPAAILVSQIQAIIRSEANNGNCIEDILRYTNQQLIRFTLKNKFVTLFYGELDRKSRQFTYVRAGHYYPFLIHNDGRVECLEAGGPALGIFSNTAFQIGKVNLETGDLVCLYTDGVTETFNQLNDEYGEERLLQVLKRNRGKAADKIIDAVLEDLKNFNESENLQDDRTLLVFKIS